MHLSALFSEPHSVFRFARARLAVMAAVAVTLAGCATTDPAEVREEPDPRFTGSIAPGDVLGDRSAQMLGVVESRLLQAFPRANWLTTRSAAADVVLDFNVYSARTTESRSTQENRSCRRWSEPDRDAKSTLQKLASRTCLDWQVQQIPCVTRKHEIDVQMRARQRGADRLVISDRKLASSTDRRCGSDAPPSAALQAQAETEVAAWAIGLLRPVLADLAARTAPARIAAVAASPLPTPTVSAPLAMPPTAATGTAPGASSAEVVTTGTPAAEAHAMATPADEPSRAGVTSFQPALRPPSSTAAPPAVPRSVEAHALVIGIANYPGSARLANPLNDARAMARKLSELGFQVTRIDDGDRDALVRGLSQFQRKAAASQITVLFYSGHGMQIDGVNYLIPINVELNKPAALKLKALPLDTIVDTYLPGRTRIVFLDACRDNPAIASNVRGISRGLAPMQVPTGTLIAYATRDGGVAEDGTGQYSPFTQALVDLIAEPEDISLILRRVRDRVMRETDGRQQPWEYGSLSGGSLVFSRLQKP